MRFPLACCVAALILLADSPIIAARPQAPGRAPMDRQVNGAVNAGQGARVLIKYRPGSGAGVRRRMGERGIVLKGDHRGGAILAATLDAGELQRWATDPDIVGISADARLTSHGGDSSQWSDVMASVDVQNLRSTLGLPAKASGGRGVGVAVIDSGIAPVPDIADRITAFYDFTAGGIPAFPSDAYGHGTHVAGLIAGSGTLSSGAYVGIAPEVRLIGMKVLDANGEGYTSHALSAIEFAIEHRVALGIDVINLSLGHPVLEPAATDPLVQAVERATAAGIVVVASAGNFGQNPLTGAIGFGGISSPGNAPSALTVGALGTRDSADRGDDRVPPYSSRGPTWYDGQIKPDIVAPGHALLATTSPWSTLYQRYGGQSPAGGYLSLSGTSMAAAVASGVVALMIDANRLDQGAPLTPNTVKMLLQYTAIAVDRPASEIPAQLEQGAGGLNAAGAIELARAIDPAAAVGTHWLERGASPSTSIADVSLPWTQQVIWGDRRVWGQAVARREPAWTSTVGWGAGTAWGPDVIVEPTSLVIDSLSLWSAQIVWGSGLVGASTDAEHIVWGNSTDAEHIVWGNSIDGNHIVWGNSAGTVTPVALQKGRQ